MFDTARRKKHIADVVRAATGTWSQVRAWGQVLRAAGIDALDRIEPCHE
jgi:hypothetical protein